MAEPKTFGRGDWMPRKKVWRVIWYKGAADIPAGDSPTRKEAEDALRKLIARGNPTPVTPELGQSIAAELDVRFNGVQEGFQEIPATMLFTDKQTGSTFAATSLERARTRLAEVRKSFEKPVSPEVTKVFPTYENLTEGQTLVDQAGDRWRITGIKREGVPAKWAYEIKGETIDLTRTRPLGEIERYYKIEQLAIPEAEAGNPGFTAKEARGIGEKLGIDFKSYDVEQFRQGLNVELEHCNVTGCDPILTGKIAQAHLNELPDYYTRLAKMEEAGSMKTETERKSFHERIFGKGTTPPTERLGKGETLNSLLPMPPEEGPPLPRMFALKWPWQKK